MALVLNGSANTIGGLAVGGLPDGIVDTDMIGAAAVTESKRGADGILQIVSSSGNGQQSTQSSSFTDIGNTSITITTKRAGSKILVQFRGGCEQDGPVNGIYFQFTRNQPSADTVVFETGQDSHWGVSSWTGVGTTWLQYLDTHGQSAGTAITYKVRWKLENTSEHLYMNQEPQNGALQMFAWEIAS